MYKQYSYSKDARMDLIIDPSGEVLATESFLEELLQGREVLLLLHLLLSSYYVDMNNLHGACFL